MHRRWIALLVVVLLAIVLAPILLLLVARPVTAPQSSPTPASLLAPSVSPSSAASGDAIPFTVADSPEDAAWYRIGREPGAFPQHLEIGTTSGDATFDVEFDLSFGAPPGAIVPTRPVAGTVDGVVVIVGDDAHASTMSAVVASTGAVHDLVTVEDVIVAAAVIAPRREVAYVTADRRSGALTGAWILSIEAPDGARPVDELVPAIGNVRLAAVVEFATILMVSPDGSMLALFRCVQLDCLLRAVRVADGSFVGEHSIDRGWGEPLGITENVAVLAPVVSDGPDAFAEMLELETGTRVRLPIEPWPSRAVVVPFDGGNPLLVLQTAGSFAPGPAEANGPEIAVIELPGLDARADLALDLGSLRIVQSNDWTVGSTCRRAGCSRRPVRRVRTA